MLGEANILSGVRQRIQEVVYVYVAGRIPIAPEQLHPAKSDKHSHKQPSRSVDQRVISFTPKIVLDMVHIRLPVNLCVCENAFIFVFWLA